jgi:hypothetical protein
MSRSRASKRTKTEPEPVLVEILQSLSTSGQAPEPLKRDSRSDRILLKVPNGKTRQRKNEALARLGVKPEDLANCPQITPILKEVRGGLSLAIKAMRFSEDDEFIGPFLDKYDSIPARDRENLSFEAIALAAGLNIKHLFGEITLAMREHEVSAVKVIAMAAHPEVMKARVEYALTPGGYRDRDKLDEILGALKPSAGPTFIGKAFFSSNKEEPDDDPNKEMVDDEDFCFPDCELIQETVQPLRQRQLPGK